MSMFVSKEKIAVTVDGRDIIYIKAKMDVGTRNRVHGSAARSMTKNKDGSVETELDIGRANTLLLAENVLDWEGPSFTDDTGKKIPCVRHNIEMLDPDEPLVEKTVDEIAARNPQKSDEDEASPNSSEATGSPSSKAGVKSQPGNGTPT